MWWALPKSTYIFLIFWSEKNELCLHWSNIKEVSDTQLTWYSSLKKYETRWRRNYYEMSLGENYVLASQIIVLEGKWKIIDIFCEQKCFIFTEIKSQITRWHSADWYWGLKKYTTRWWRNYFQKVLVEYYVLAI